MNKLLFVNIGGLVFQIDESAFRKLDNYLNSIRRKYASTAEGEEIIRDIENRVAELFTQAVGERGAIMDNHVDEVIGVMGAPDAFEDPSFQEQAQRSGEQKPPRASRFFRDKDNHILGGVCSGIAARFDMDPLWIRLLFLIAFFFGGSGFLLYIILWIIIPEAKTTAEKLEMRGEKVDISNIERTVRDGAKQFGDKMQDLGNEVKTTFSKENIDKTKRNTGDFIEGAVETAKPAFRWIGKALAMCILVVALVVLLVLSIELFTNWGRNLHDIEFFGNHITEGSDQAWLLITCALALIIIPLLGIVISMVKYLLGLRRKTRFISVFLGTTWTVALIAVIYIGITIGRNFKEEASVSNRIDILQPAGGTLHLRIQEIPGDAAVNEHTFFGIQKDGKDKHILRKDDTLLYERIAIRFERSVDTNYVVIVKKSARGYDEENAQENAEDFAYACTQSGDSILQIPSRIALKSGEQWREQSIEILVRVPMSKYIWIDAELEKFIDNNEYTANLRDIELFNNRLQMTAYGLQPALSW